MLGYHRSAFGASRVANSAYQKWPTWRLDSSHHLNEEGDVPRAFRVCEYVEITNTPRRLNICFTARNSSVFVSSYPERNFGKNQLLDSSMSLSPLYLNLTSDLHVSTAFGRPPSFHEASSGSGKARYLSGPRRYTLLQIPFTEDQDRALLHG